jgi:hypothetical protein
MQSNEETRKDQIRGFLPFSEGARVSGELIAAKMRDDGSGKGYYLIRCDSDTIVNVRDVESKSGQGTARAGEIVGVRKTGATKILSRLMEGDRVQVTYIKFAEKEGINPKTGIKEAAMYHYVDIDVYQSEELGREAA